MTVPAIFQSRPARAMAAAAVLAGGMLVAPTAQAAAFPQFTLPFAVGQVVGSAGIHSDNGRAGVKNAIDLNPRDELVRAPLAGTVSIQRCSGGDWVTIDHEGGWRTGYYHMENITVTDGQRVEPGTALGNIGNALPCGGSSSGAHVHFTLWTLGAAAARSDDPIAAGNWDGVSYDRLSAEVTDAVGEAVTGKTFGGWRFTEGSEQYAGTATEVSTGKAVELPGRFKYEG